MKFFIKNMLCIRCKTALKDELEKLNIPCKRIDMGVVETYQDISEGKLDLLRNNLLQIGLEIMRNRKEMIAENITKAIIEFVHYSSEPVKINLSDFLRDKLPYEYSHLTNVFSEVKGISIEKFFIDQKVERVKDLLMNDELNLTEIAALTNYSSVAHLSNQFKRKTGLSAIQYRQLHSKTLYRSSSDDHKTNYRQFA
jgi:AraC-like DNA-binding protein